MVGGVDAGTPVDQGSEQIVFYAVDVERQIVVAEAAKNGDAGAAGARRVEARDGPDRVVAPGAVEDRGQRATGQQARRQAVGHGAANVHDDRVLPGAAGDLIA